MSWKSSSIWCGVIPSLTHQPLSEPEVPCLAPLGAGCYWIHCCDRYDVTVLRNRVSSLGAPGLRCAPPRSHTLIPTHAQHTSCRAEVCKAYAPPNFSLWCGATWPFALRLCLLCCDERGLVVGLAHAGVAVLVVLMCGPDAQAGGSSAQRPPISAAACEWASAARAARLLPTAPSGTLCERPSRPAPSSLWVGDLRDCEPWRCPLLWRDNR